MRLSLKNIIVPSIPLAVVLVGFSVLLWIADFGTPSTKLSSGDSVLSENIQSLFSANAFITNIISLVLTLLNAFLISQLNNRFTIIRTRTFLPLLIFLVLISSWSQTHTTVTSHLSLTLFIFSLFNFFNMSRDKNASEQAFTGSLLISLCSLLIHQYIFLIPICWIGFIFFQSLSLRTLLASIFGTLAPWVIFLAISYFINPSINLLQFVTFNFNFELDFLSIKLQEIIYISSISLIMIIGIFGLFSISNSDATSTRNKLNFLVFLLVILSIVSFIFRNQFNCFLPIIALAYSLLISHPLTLKQSNFYGILLVIFIVLNIAFIISKHILI